MNESPEIVCTSDALLRLVVRLEREKILAFDLEADSMHHYTEKVCLIQVSTEKETTLTDPLPLSDLSPLAPIMADPAIIKVFHGADYDVRSLHRDFRIEINNLFDTMIACQFLGEKEIGLAAALKKRFGVELDKKYQKADWSRRPLSPEMIAYAACDTSMLIPLFRQLESELREKGRLAWVEEECALLTRVRAASRENDQLYLRFKGAAKMSPRSLAVLEELLRYRDEKGRLRDKPPYMIFSGETVRELAEKRPRSLRELAGISGLSPRQAERYGKGILEAVARGCAVSEEMLQAYPRSERPRRDSRQEACIKRLKTWREEKAALMGIDAGVLANNALLEALSGQVPSCMEMLDQIPVMREWQKELFGQEIIAIISQR